MPRFRVIEGPDRGHVLDLPATAIVGSAEGCTLVLADPAVPGRALKVMQKPSGIQFKVLSLIGAVSVNQRAARQGRLRDGDQLRIGDTLLAFEDEEDPEAFAEAPEDAEVVRRTARARREARSSAPALRALLAAPEDAGHVLQSLLRVGESLRSLDDLQGTLAAVLDILFEILQPDRGAVVLFDEENQRFRVTVRRADRGDTAPGGTFLSRAILQEIHARREGLLLVDAREDGRFEGRKSVARRGIRSLLGAPLLAGDRFLGAIVLDAVERAGAFTDSDLNVLVVVAFQAALAVENARLAEAMQDKAALEREQELAGEIQRWLVARDLPQREDVHVAASTQAAHGVSGDYHDVLPCGDGLLVAVGDVSGKGINAGLVMMMARSALLPLVDARLPLLEMLAELHAQLLRDTTPGIFMTLLLLRWDPATGVLSTAAAGHETILVRPPGGGDIREIPAGGVPLGLSLKQPARFVENTVDFDPGTTVLLYSDGVTEARNPVREQFGRPRLRAAFARHGALPLPDLVAAVQEEVMRFSRGTPQHDDMTLLALRRV